MSILSVDSLLPHGAKNGISQAGVQVFHLGFPVLLVPSRPFIAAAISLFPEVCLPLEKPVQPLHILLTVCVEVQAGEPVDLRAKMGHDRHVILPEPAVMGKLLEDLPVLALQLPVFMNLWDSAGNHVLPDDLVDLVQLQGLIRNAVYHTGFGGVNGGELDLSPVFTIGHFGAGRIRLHQGNMYVEIVGVVVNGGAPYSPLHLLLFEKGIHGSPGDFPQPVNVYTAGFGIIDPVFL